MSADTSIAHDLRCLADGFLNYTDSRGGVEVMKARVSAKDFVFKYCFTLDPHDKKMPIKRFPQYEYLERMVDIWEESDLLLVVKSRQMMASWLYVALNLWDAMHHQGRTIFFVSKKEQDAGFDSQLSLLSRALFMLERLPESMRPKYKKGLQPPKLEFPELHSSIMAMSQDSEGLRQYTASRILSDEMAFQERAEKAYIAMKPTLDGGGALCGISTPNGRNNLFYYLANDIVKGQKEKTTLITAENDPRARIESISKGVGLRKNRNGYSVINLHWSASPKKDDNWKAESQKSYVSLDAWNQEQELDFNKTEGQRVFPGFRIDAHVKQIKANPYRTIWRGWDFGYNHPACVWLQMDELGRLNVLHELLGEEILINEFAAEVKAISRRLFPGCGFKDAGDPAGQAVNDKSERTTVDVLRALGIRVNMRKRPVREGINTIRGLLIPQGDVKSRFVIDPQCEHLIDGFLGGYTRNDEEEPIKDGFYEHLFDAMRYYCNVQVDPKTYKEHTMPRVYIPPKRREE